MRNIVSAGEQGGDAGRSPPECHPSVGCHAPPRLPELTGRPEGTVWPRRSDSTLNGQRSPHRASPRRDQPTGCFTSGQERPGVRVHSAPKSRDMCSSRYLPVFTSPVGGTAVGPEGSPGRGSPSVVRCPEPRLGDPVPCVDGAVSEVVDPGQLARPAGTASPEPVVASATGEEPGRPRREKDAQVMGRRDCGSNAARPRPGSGRAAHTQHEPETSWSRTT